MSRLTLLDIAKHNGNEQIIGLIEEVNLVVPEVQLFPARTIRGTSFRTLVRTRYPEIGFRLANDGTDPVKSSYENRMFECAIINGRMEVDKAVADAAEEGAESVKAREAVGYMRGAMGSVARQIWYGQKKGGHKNGFPGIAEIVDDAMRMGNPSAGLTANTASSVFAVNLSETDGVAMILGGDGQGILGRELEWRTESMTGQNGKPLTGYVADLPAWIGLQSLTRFAAARLDNITADEDKGLNDLWLAKLVNNFEEKSMGIRPTHLFMSFRSRQQLQFSRSLALIGTGTVRPNQPMVAPMPTEYEGIPIVTTTAISNDEAIVTR